MTKVVRFALLVGSVNTPSAEQMEPSGSANSGGSIPMGLCEGDVRLNGVAGNPDECGVQCGEVSGPLTEVLRFDRSAGRGVLGIRPQHDRFRPAEVGEVKGPYWVCPLIGGSGLPIVTMEFSHYRLIGTRGRTSRIWSPTQMSAGLPFTGTNRARSRQVPMSTSQM